MIDLAQSNSFIPYGNNLTGLSPQGFDFGQFAQQIASQVLPALPGVILGALAAHPVTGPQVRAQIATTQALAPQSLLNFGINTPIGGAGLGLFGATPRVGLTPQGFDFGQLAQQLAGQILPTIVPAILGALSAHPVIGPQVRAQIATTQGLAPQSLINLGIGTPFGSGGLGLFGSTPSVGLTPQGFDFGQFAQQVAGQVVPYLPGLIMSAMSSNPLIGQQVRSTTH